LDESVQPNSIVPTARRIEKLTRNCLSLVKDRLLRLRVAVLLQFRRLTLSQFCRSVLYTNDGNNIDVVVVDDDDDGIMVRVMCFKGG
jgi:hypothetical protein